MKSYRYRVELEEDDEEGGWTAVIPALPGCASEGDTAEEALENVREAAQAYVEVLLELGRPVPLENESAFTDDEAVLITSSVA